MPRKNPLPPEELEVGVRVRIVREKCNLTRTRFARELITDSSTIANIERGRVPLRFELAELICGRFRINHRWLATGQLPVNYVVQFYGYSSRIPPRTTFRKAYVEFLSVVMEATLKHAAEKAHRRVEDLEDAAVMHLKAKGLSPTLSGSEEIESRERQFLQWSINILASLPPVLHSQFLAAIGDTTEQFYKKNQRAISEYRRQREEAITAKPLTGEELLAQLEETVDVCNEKRDILEMSPSPYALLLNRVGRIVGARGMKAELARTLQVPRQRVSEWLNGASSPSAAKTLELLKWVEAAETKDPAGARTPTGKTTRSDKSIPNEKAKSNRPKG